MMSRSFVLGQLGFNESDRVVVINADDIGMCHATVPAFFELIEFGVVSAGSVMAPCPWFPEVANLASRNPSADLGVHLTLTSESGSSRWGPISTRDHATGLLDDQGYFHSSQLKWGNLDPEAGLREMRAQVDRARKAGIDVTHLDSHGFSVLDSRLLGNYIKLGFEERLPVLMVRHPHITRTLSDELIDRWETEGLPVFDHFREMPLTESADGRLEWAKRILDELPAGLSCFIIHPAHDTPELRAISSNWRQRVADYETFMSGELRDHVSRSGIHVIGWRVLREAMRANRQSAALTPS